MKKKSILESARANVLQKIVCIEAFREKIGNWVKEAKNKLDDLSSIDKLTESQLIGYNEKRLQEMTFLQGSPYFIRCDVLLEHERKQETLYFGKFGFSEGKIYSWIAPASAVRFENPGPFRFYRPDGREQRGTLLRKDQFIIVDGQIKFMATESTDEPRELIYQEHFTNRKSGFVLPEIVAQMEKAQDMVIRAPHAGPFVISGPAGSGKTTLALHRVAYLLQSPDVADYYTGESVIVFVQDAGTKKYFSALLPELGIDNVCITTFSDWSMGMMGLDMDYGSMDGTSEELADLYQYAKLSALHRRLRGSFDAKDVWSCLEANYADYLSQELRQLFDEQKRANRLDHIDLTLLLRLYHDRNGSLGEIMDYYVEQKNGEHKKKRGYVSKQYSLMVIDEFQNYLPEQLDLMRSTLNMKHASMLYVGDMAQQVRFGTINDFGQINEKVSAGRKVVLHKVYRNTKKILEYISSLGYQVEIPEGLREGEEVEEMSSDFDGHEVQLIKNKLEGKDANTVGILAKNRLSLAGCMRAFANDPRVHMMTMSESQGVEFDLVFLLADPADFAAVAYGMSVPEEMKREKGRINRDLLYVALTRAISNLYIIKK